MSSHTFTLYDAVAHLPSDSTLVVRNVTWDEYEDLLEVVGESSDLRISYDGGTLHVMTLSSRHEKYAELLKMLLTLLSLKLRTKILFYGSTTIRKQSERKGAEPDACFYVQNAAAVERKDELDFAEDPPPDVVVEVDLTHGSLAKFPIYAALGVPEIWRYDGQDLTMYGLDEGSYAPLPSSVALPMLSSEVLSGFLARAREADQYEALLAFERWLDEIPAAEDEIRGS